MSPERNTTSRGRTSYKDCFVTYGLNESVYNFPVGLGIAFVSGRINDSAVGPVWPQYISCSLYKRTYK
jgi:hypothetical protein